MKELVISSLEELNYNKDIAKISLRLDSLDRNKLVYSPWPSFPYNPDVQFVASYSYDCIFLKYYVNEKNIRAENKAINSSVWEDSCVEFFISFDDTGYYNFEFNCIGTALVGFGKEKINRHLLPADLIGEIKLHHSLLKTEKGFHWELTVAIPSHIFICHPPLILQGKKARANFYKCGDLLPEPHFVSWTNIESAEPNFHLPEFFGTLTFA